MKGLAGGLAVLSDVVLLGAVVVIIGGPLGQSAEGWLAAYWILVPFLICPAIPAIVSWVNWEELVPIKRLQMNLPLAIATLLIGVILWRIS